MAGLSKTLMVQGCTSDAGKSVITAGLCRVLHRRGIKAAPFKPQNMALNSAVTVDGKEIGRAQAVQAQACGIPAHSDMNPILLKPNSDTGAQVIIHGEALSNMEAQAYHDYKPRAMQAVLESYQRLQSQYQAIIVEGAGSPAEINLREGDVANMGFAEAVDCPVVLVADIDRGGVFAHLVGTLALLSESEQARVQGFIINKFRGDIALLQSGLDWLEQKTGKPVIGVLPYLRNLNIEAEDSLSNEQQLDAGIIKICVPVLSRISNHTDFDPLRAHPDIDFSYVGPGQDIPPCELIVLPGSKSTLRDLQFLRDQGWHEQIAKHLRYGGKVFGVCGGYQMLGNSISDPLYIESDTASLQGLGYLDISTELREEKQLLKAEGQLCIGEQIAAVRGYEIHCGETQGPGLQRPVWRNATKRDGAISADQAVAGCYLHGVFDEPSALQALIHWANGSSLNAIQAEEDPFDRLADAFETHLDLAALGLT